MRNTIEKPHVTTTRGGAGAIIRENPLMNISVSGGRYVVQGGFVMFEDGTVVENPPGAFWTEYAKVSPEMQEKVNLNALTRQPFAGAVAEKEEKRRLAQEALDEATREADDAAAKERDTAAIEAAKRSEERTAREQEIKDNEDKELADRRKATADKLAKLESDEEEAARLAAANEASKNPKTNEAPENVNKEEDAAKLVAAANQKREDDKKRAEADALNAKQVAEDTGHRQPHSGGVAGPANKK